MNEKVLPMKILVRGDCTSYRAVHLNKEIFSDNFIFIQNQKSPFVLFLDHANGIDASQEKVISYIDICKMPLVQRLFFLGQFERTILHQESADLLIMDSYADMNFELFEANDAPGKLWVNRSFIKDMEAFEQNFHSIGKRTLKDSMEDAINFIHLIRQMYGNIPVIFLNQQVEMYPKLLGRMEYYELGRLVSERIENCQFGGTLLRDELELADIGSCGPGLTLHYTGTTYRKMLDRIPLLAKAVQSKLAAVSPLSVPSKVIPKVVTATTGQTENRLLPVVDPSEKPLEIAFRSPNRKPLYKSETLITGFQRYFIIQNAGILKPKVVPAIIELSEVQNYRNWATRLKKLVGDNAFRSEKKAIQRGFFVEIFDRRTFIPDIYAINTSMPVRSGQPMHKDYMRTVEELGGWPTEYVSSQLPKDEHYWSLMFGVFTHAPGWMQGEVVTDKRLLGYITVRRINELVYYPQLLGHGDFLQDGIMALCHFHILRWLTASENNYAANSKALMYTNADAPNEGLRIWKKRAGFKPRRISLVSY